ncbi:AAA family ATPase [Persicobacter diffluens]|uniref:Chromosome partitioning protein ParA n=1 Tax=Persicobacter diffluens TaxID=981 RepID=A0AAN4W4T2_9BACT|nr:chromosome partitioning protein ParA [Persicobacter diffluens]
MIILMANQKGGVGKTTLSILLANFLAEKGKSTCVIDLDVQKSVVDNYNNALGKGWSNALIQVYDGKSAPDLKQLKQEGKVVIIDLPGRLDNKIMQSLIKKADAVICPFIFDPITFKSTLVFAQLCTVLIPGDYRSKLFFLPNKVKSSVKLENEKEIHKILKRFGKITPRIPDLVCFQRIPSFSINQEQAKRSQNAFDYLMYNL